MGIIRILLAIAVVVFHCSPQTILGVQLISGELAVQTFFIISGFYMSLVLNEKYIGANDSYSLFISNRFLRIFPLYWLVFILSIFYAGFVYFFINKSIVYQNPFTPNLRFYVEHFRQFDFLSLVILVISNVFIFLQDLTMFLKLNPDGSFGFTSNFHNTNPMVNMFLIVPQAWSVSLELMFYLIAPFVLRKKVAFAVGLISLAFILRFYLTFALGLTNDPWTYRFFPTELAYFFLGRASYEIYKRIKTLTIQPIYFIAALGFMLAVIFLLGYKHSPRAIYFHFASFVVLLPFVFMATKKWRIDNYIGELSYPIYISHILIFAVIDSSGINTFGQRSFFAVIFSIIFSILINESFLTRIEKIRQGRVLKKQKRMTAQGSSV